jgi:flavin reductase (DIM6/NTAB) family NADH-FMN oxidoreductase RutF
VDEELRSRFLTGMSHAACTVSIVTTDGPGGRAGVTVSAMASVSADTPKPTMLVCVHHLSPAAAAIVENKVLCVNVLRDDQSYISDTFAGRFKDQVANKFDCTDWVESPSGAPRISDPLVAFDCTLLSGERIGTHHIFLCEVQDLYVSSRGSPLIYANRAYGSSNRIDGATTLRRGVETAKTKLAVGCFHTFGPHVLPGLIRGMAEGEERVNVHLVEGDHRRLQESLLAGETEVALLYDLSLSDDLDTIPLATLAPYVLLPDGHPLSDKAEIDPAELAEEPMVLLDAPPSRDYFLSLMEDAGVLPDVAYRSRSFEMVRGMVGHGLGYALLATKPASDMTYDGLALAARPLAGTHRESHVMVAHRKGLALSPAARQFVARCQAAFNLGAPLPSRE